MSDTSTVAYMPVSSFLGDPVACVAADASVAAVAGSLVDAGLGALVVGDRRRPEGIVSERDVVRALAAGRDLTATHAIDIATTKLVWCDATATVGEVATEMMEHYVRHVLVEQDGRLVGIVSSRDLLGAFAADFSLDQD